MECSKNTRKLPKTPEKCPKTPEPLPKTPECFERVSKKMKNLCSHFFLGKTRFTAYMSDFTF